MKRRRSDQRHWGRLGALTFLCFVMWTGWHLWRAAFKFIGFM